MPVSPCFLGRICKWKCGTDCPPTVLSFHAKLNPSASKVLSSVFLILSANSHRAFFSSLVKSSNFWTQRTGQTRMCPGTMGMLVGNAHTKSFLIMVRCSFEIWVQNAHFVCMSAV